MPSSSMWRRRPSTSSSSRYSRGVALPTFPPPRGRIFPSITQYLRWGSGPSTGATIIGLYWRSASSKKSQVRSHSWTWASASITAMASTPSCHSEERSDVRIRTSWLRILTSALGLLRMTLLLLPLPDVERADSSRGRGRRHVLQPGHHQNRIQVPVQRHDRQLGQHDSEQVARELR